MFSRLFPLFVALALVLPASSLAVSPDALKIPAAKRAIRASQPSGPRMHIRECHRVSPARVACVVRYYWEAVDGSYSGHFDSHAEAHPGGVRWRF